MKKLTCIFFTAILFVSAGCKKSFFDINTNPNSATEESITPDLLLPRIEHRIAEKMAVSYGNYAGWMGYWARSGTYGPNAEEESYSITTNFEADEWNWYDILFDADVMEKKATALGQTRYVGIAKVLKTIGFMYLVDQYNNVPYSKAFDLTNNITPSYDKGADIYKDLLAQLETARGLIEESADDANPNIATADVIFHGDVDAWMKLANSQSLKLLIHEAAVVTNAAEEIAKITANGYGFLDAPAKFATNLGPNQGDLGGAFVQPGYQPVVDKQNPFYATYDTAPTGSAVNQFWRANNFILFQMYGVDGNSYLDSRLFYTFDEAATPISTSLEDHYYGYNYGEIIPNTDPKAANSADVSGPGISINSAQPQWLFTAMESLFHQAEAIERGWLPGGTTAAEAKFREAIEASFEFVGNGSDPSSDYTSVEEYLEQEAPAAFHARVLDYTGTSANKIRIINTQKYIALCGINNFEAYVDYRRLDGEMQLFNTAAEQQQLLSLAPGVTGKKIPTRIQYPQAEYNFNAANVAAEGTINTQESLIFWDVKKHD